MRRRITREQRREILRVGGDLTTLGQHPSWPTFEQEVEHKVLAIERMVVKRAMSRNPMSAEEQGYYRGFCAAARWLVSVPNNAEAKLEHFLREQGLSAEEATK